MVCLVGWYHPNDCVFDYCQLIKTPSMSSMLNKQTCSGLVWDYFLLKFNPTWIRLITKTSVIVKSKYGRREATTMTECTLNFSTFTFHLNP